jgi:hypothetical protein
MLQAHVIHENQIHVYKGNNKLPNSEQSYKVKVKTHNYIKRTR